MPPRHIGQIVKFLQFLNDIPFVFIPEKESLNVFDNGFKPREALKWESLKFSGQ